MAKIIKTQYEAEYHSLKNERVPGENKDCAVIAIAAVTGCSYLTARESLSAAGRKEGRGTFHHQTRNVLKALGFKLVKVDLDEIRSKFPEPHRRVLKNVTTHHPRRFPGTFPAEGNYLIWTSGHILAFCDGKVLDWSINNSLRILNMTKVIRIKEEGQ